MRWIITGAILLALAGSAFPATTPSDPKTQVEPGTTFFDTSTSPSTLRFFDEKGLGDL